MNESNKHKFLKSFTKIIYYCEINARSAPDLAKFYTDIFDWKYEYEVKKEFFYFKTSDDKGGIDGGIFTGKGKIRPQRALYMLVDNVDDTIEKVKQAGGKYYRTSLKLKQ